MEEYKPNLRIDPSLWSEKLFSDTVIPDDVKAEIEALQKSIEGEAKAEEAPAEMPPEGDPDQDSTPKGSKARKNRKKKSEAQAVPGRKSIKK